MSETKQKVASGIFSLGSANLFSQIITWVFTILVARLLTPQDYGLVEMSAIYIGFAELFNEFGIGAAIVQREKLSTNLLRATYSFALLLGLCFTLISLPIAHLLASFFNEPRLVMVVYILSITFIISSAKNVQRNLMTRRMEFAAMARIEVIARIGSSLLTYYCAWIGLGYWALVVMYLSFNGLQALLYFYHVRILPGKIESVSQIREVLKFGGQVMLSRIIRYFAIRIDTMIVGKMLGTSLLGTYSMALNLGNKPVDKVMAIMNQVFFPLFSKTRRDEDKLRAYFLKTVSMELYILCPIFILLFYTADDLLPLLLGSQWEKAVPPFKVFISIAIFFYFKSRLSVLALAIGKPKYEIFCNSIMLVAMSSTMILLGYLYKMQGILAVWLTVFPLLTVCYQLFLNHKIGIKISTFVMNIKSPLLVSILTCIITTLSLSISLDSPVLRIIVTTSICLSTYCLSFFLLDKNKLHELLSIIRRK